MTTHGLRRAPRPAAAAAIAEAEAARPIAEADRGRTALLAAVSHDLRTPLAAARAVLLTASACGDQVELCVVDYGPGVPEADRDRMFAPFQRLHDTTSGVGLGLTVSRGLTQAMGGSLEPGGTPGGGLTMTMSVPPAPARPGRAGRRPASPHPVERKPPDDHDRRYPA